MDDTTVRCEKSTNTVEGLKSRLKGSLLFPLDDHVESGNIYQSFPSHKKIKRWYELENASDKSDKYDPRGISRRIPTNATSFLSTYPEPFLMRNREREREREVCKSAR